MAATEEDRQAAADLLTVPAVKNGIRTAMVLHEMMAGWGPVRWFIWKCLTHGQTAERTFLEGVAGTAPFLTALDLPDALNPKR